MCSGIEHARPLVVVVTVVELIEPQHMLPHDRLVLRATRQCGRRGSGQESLQVEIGPRQGTGWRAIGATRARAADAIGTAMYLDQIALPGLAVQAVDVLGD